MHSEKSYRLFSCFLLKHNPGEPASDLSVYLFFALIPATKPVLTPPPHRTP